MIDAATQTTAQSHIGRTEPFGAPSDTSEVNRLANFYRVECLTVFGTARCETETRAEMPEFEFQAAA